MYSLNGVLVSDDDFFFFFFFFFVCVCVCVCVFWQLEYISAARDIKFFYFLVYKVVRKGGKGGVSHVTLKTWFRAVRYPLTLGVWVGCLCSRKRL